MSYIGQGLIVVRVTLSGNEGAAKEASLPFSLGSIFALDKQVNLEGSTAQTAIVSRHHIALFQTGDWAEIERSIEWNTDSFLHIL